MKILKITLAVVAFTALPFTMACDAVSEITELRFVTYEDGGNAQALPDTVAYTDGGCRWQNDDNADTSDGGDFYTDGYGIRISVPSHWKPCANDSSPAEWEFQNPNGGSAGVWVTEYFDSLEGYTEHSRTNIEREFGVSEIHEERTTTFAGLPAYSINYTDSDGFRWLEVMAVRGGEAFHFWYVASVSRFNRNLSAVQRMLDSVEFIAP